MRLITVLWQEISVTKYQSQIHWPLEHMELTSGPETVPVM